MVVAGGKGGVGKSMVASSLALLLSKEKKVVAVDCDVDAANLGLWLGVNTFENERKVSTSIKAEINAETCIACGRCFQKCRFGAIEKKEGKYAVNRLLCEGCEVCKIVCPAAGTVNMRKVYNGLVQSNEKDLDFPLISGKLFPGERCSGKIVAEVRKEADRREHEVMVLDAAAGIGCTVNAAVVNTDYAVLVTEPTPSGLSDLKRVLTVVNHFKVPYCIIINRWDINPGFSEKIEKFAGEKLAGKISYDRGVVDAIVLLTPVLETGAKAADELKEVLAKVPVK